MSVSTRQRRGLSVFESVLAVMAGSLLLGSVIELADRISRRTLLQAEARIVSSAADGVLANAESDISQAIAAATAAGGATRLTRAALLADGSLDQGFPERSPSGRAFGLAHYAASSDTVLAVAWLEGGPIAAGTSLPATGIRSTGRVGGADGACPTGFICGPGLRRDVTAMLTALGTSGPAVGSMIAIRSTSLLRIHDTLLHSGEYSGRPELARMDADLEVTGDMANVSTASASSVQLQILSGGQAHVETLVDAGTSLQAARVELRGELSVGGDLTASGAISGIGITRANGAQFNTITAGEARLDITGGATFGNSIEIGLPAARSGGAVSQESGLLEAGSLSAPSLRAPWLDTANVEVAATGTVTATQAELGELRSHAAAARNLVSGQFRSSGTLYVDDCPNCGTAP